MALPKYRCRGCGDTIITDSDVRRIEFATTHEAHVPSGQGVLERVERSL